MKKLLFILCVLLFGVLMIPRRGGAETPVPTPLPNGVKAQVLAAKQASYPAWVGDEARYLPGQEPSPDDSEMTQDAPEDVGDWVMTVLQLFTDNSWEIYMFYHYDYGASKIRLTSHPASDILPNLNRGATQIVFASNRDGNYEIYQMDTNGNSVVRLTSNNTIDSQPSWSFDNSQIAFVSDRDGNAEIYKMNADGAEQIRLTNDPATDISPAWSPDGTKIGFLRVSGYSASVWIMNSDGSNPHAISAYFPYAQHLRWSPDGVWLTLDCDLTGDGWNEIAIIKPDGTDLQQIDSGNNLLDKWVSGWTPNSQELLGNHVTYIVIDGQLYIFRTDPFKISFEGNTQGFGLTYDFDMNLHSQSTEIDSPVSHITPLPNYSKTSDFSLDWTANDVGQAGIWYIDLDKRVGNSGIWADLLETTGTSGSIDYSGTPGETIYFRSRAIDNAENVEPWPTGGWDTFTTFYLWSLNGQVFDNRENGLPSSTLSVSPLAINSEGVGFDGRFIRYHSVTTATVSVSQSGYSSALPTIFNGDENQDWWWSLSPVDNHISNGDFENDQLMSWQISGSFTSTRTSEVYHLGEGAAKIGQSDLAGPATNLSSNEGDSRQPQIVRTSDNVLHTVWADFTSIPGDPTPSKLDLFYSFKAPGLPWSLPVIITPAHQNNTYFPYLEVGPDGTIHLVWIESVTTYGLGELKYASKPLGGNWSVPVVIDQISDAWNFLDTPIIAIDSIGGLHVTWTPGDDGIYYLYKPQAGIWTSSLQLDYSSGYLSMAIDINDRIYVIWAAEDLYYMSKPLGVVGEQFK
jgi:hypothetical protein